MLNKHKAIQLIKPNLNFICLKYNPEISLFDKDKKIKIKFLHNNQIKQIQVNFQEEQIDLKNNFK
jgi:hypothetical protein